MTWLFFHWGSIYVKAIYSLRSILLKGSLREMTHSKMPDIEASRCSCRCFCTILCFMQREPIKTSWPTISFRYCCFFIAQRKRLFVIYDDHIFVCQFTSRQYSRLCVGYVQHIREL